MRPTTQLIDRRIETLMFTRKELIRAYCQFKEESILQGLRSVVYQLMKLYSQSYHGVKKYDPYRYCPNCGSRSKVNDWECNECGFEYGVSN